VSQFYLSTDRTYIFKIFIDVHNNLLSFGIEKEKEDLEKTDLHALKIGKFSALDFYDVLDFFAIDCTLRAKKVGHQHHCLDF
jgi:hypothetical protein